MVKNLIKKSIALALVILTLFSTASISSIDLDFFRVKTFASTSTPYYNWKQYDSQWGNKTIGTKTISQIGCAATSIAMLIVHSGLKNESNFDPGTFVSSMKNVGGFKNNDIIWGKVGSAVPGFEYYTSYTFSDKTSYSNKVAKIKSYVDNGYYVVVTVNNYGHYVAVYGATDSKVTMMDPNTYSSDLSYYYNSGIVNLRVYSSSGNGYDGGSGYVEPDASSLSLSGASIPSSISRGSGFTVKGTVSSNYNLEWVYAAINSSDGTPLYISSASPYTKSYNLNNFDSALKFGALGVGTYTYHIEATDVSGNFKVLNSTTFTVTGKTEDDISSSSSLSLNSYNYPRQLTKGSSFYCKGIVNSTYPLEWVAAYIKNSSGNVVYIGSASPYTKSYDISTTIDAALKFPYLSAGDYTYFVEATDNKHHYEMLLNQSFTVEQNGEWNISFPGIPETLPYGYDYDISGTITAPRPFEYVCVFFYNYSTGKQEQVYMVDPGTSSYNLANFNEKIHFENLSPGTYSFQVEATDYDHVFKVLSQGTFTIASPSSINYNANGGTGAPSSQSKPYGKDITLSSSKPTKSYYLIYDLDGGSANNINTSVTANCTFINWINAKTGATYAPGTVYHEAEGADLIAQWKNPTVELFTPTKEGYVFKGWYDYNNATAVTGSTYELQSNTTLTAVWADETNPAVSYSSTNNTSAVQTLTLSLSDNVGIDGFYWGTSQNYLENAYTSIESSPKSATEKININNNGKYYLTVIDTYGNIFNKNFSYYKTVYSANGGTTPVNSVLTLSGKSFTLPKPEKSGYICTRWNTKADGSGTAYAVGAKYTATNNVTLYAQWTEDTVSGIKVKSEPTKLIYFKGETLDTTGLVVAATYVSDKTENISSGFTCSPTKLNSTGTQTITVSYMGFTTDFEITVKPLTVTGIAIRTTPAKTDYYVGDALNTSGLTLTVFYDNGSQKAISSGFNCTPMTFSTVGTQTITVTYGGSIATFAVNVSAVPAASHTITFVVDGRTYSTAVYKTGEGIQLPTEPVKPGYKFRNWNPLVPASMPDEDITVEAVFNPIKYNAVFTADSTTVAVIPYTVETLSITEPAVPSKNGSNGKWSAYSLDEGGVTVYAVYTPKTFTVPVVADGRKIAEATYTYGDTELVNLPAVPEKAGYTGKWEYNLTSDGAQANAIYTAVTYYATFTADGRKVGERIPFTVETRSINEPDVPSKSGYTGRWNAYTLAANDITVTAVYELINTPAEPSGRSATVSIRNFRSTVTEDYKSTLTFTAVTSDIPEGATIHWIINGKDMGTGETYTVERATSDYNVQIKVVGADGSTVAESETETVKIRSGFLEMLIAFFRQLLGSLPENKQ